MRNLLGSWSTAGALSPAAEVVGARLYPGAHVGEEATRTGSGELF